MNYFDIIGIEPKYEIDKVEVENKYIELQKKYHPDNYVPCEEEDNDDAILYNALKINTAYNILMDDLKRAIYLLKTHNFDIENDANKIMIDNNILKDIFMEREYIEYLDDDQLLKTALDETIEKIKNIILQLSQAFSNNEYLKALQLTVQFKYLDVLKKLIIKKLN
jgi:molecular chaperone HscB